MTGQTMPLHAVIERGHNIGLGPSDYPIFDESYRDHLNKIITDHYWHSDIGYETVEMFVFNINRKMREIMPYYNQLYLSTRFTFDPLLSVNVTEIIETTDSRTANESRTENSDTNSHTDSKARSVQSETPQSMLSGDMDYASSAQDTGSDSTVATTAQTGGTAATTGSGEGRTERSQRGYTGSAGTLVMQYRETLINVDLMVLADLESCFMMVWNSGDAYYPYGSPYGYGFGGFGGFGYGVSSLGY